MYMSESEFSVLTTYANPVEASALCSWLEAGNIPCIVQQSEHHSGLPMGSDILEVQVLVAPRDLECARTLLESKVETSQERAAALDACVQEAPPSGPVYGEISTAVYFGYGTLLSARGDVQGSSPLGEEIQEHTRTIPSQTWYPRRPLLLTGGLVFAFLFVYGLFMLLQ